MLSRLNYKLPLRILAAILAGTGVSARAASTDFGRFESTVSAHEDYDSNIFLNSSAVRDFISTGDVSGKFIHDTGILSAQVTVAAEASVYQSHAEQNTFDPSVNAGLSFTPSDKTTVVGTISYARVTMANEAVNDRTRSNNLDFDGSLQNLFSEKLGYRVTAGYHADRYLATDATAFATGYSDVLWYTAGVDAVYQYSPKLTMLIGYDYRESWIENRAPGTGNPASRDNRVSVGFEGDVAPKLTGTFKIGGESRHFQSFGFSNSSALFVESSLKWLVAEKTSVNLLGSEDFNTDAASQSSKDASVTLSLTQELNKQWTFDTSVAYSHDDYQGLFFRENTVQNAGRTDRNYRVRGRLTYALTTNVSFDASLGVGRVDSTSQFSTYHRLSVALGVTATY